MIQLYNDDCYEKIKDIPDNSDKIVYTYDWNANPDSLCKQYNRGDIKQER